VLLSWLDGTRPLRIFVALDPARRADAVLFRLDELRELGPCEVTAGFVMYPEVRHAGAVRAPAAFRGHEFKAGDERAALGRELAGRGIDVAQVEPTRHPETKLVERAAAANADLLITTSHPHDDLAILPHRCLATGVLRRAPMNVLTVPEADIEPPRSAHGALSARPQRNSEPSLSERGATV
jgi:nucleotide-binding universal stress UspA family protein